MTVGGLQHALRTVADWEQHHTSSIPRPILAADRKRRSVEDRVAGVITDFAGSMGFVYIHTAWFGLWLVINAGLLVIVSSFDPFPFGLLTLIVSLEAIFLSTFVMIAQNRQASVADARAMADYSVNMQAEAEIEMLLHLVQALVEHHAQLAETRGWRRR